MNSEVLDALTPIAASIACASAVSCPGAHTPTMRTSAVPSDSASRCRLAHVEWGMTLIRLDQPRTTAAALDHGNDNRKKPSEVVGWVWYSNWVTMPKFPPPPPRRAHSRSGFAARARPSGSTPSAVTIRAESSWSQVKPYCRLAIPRPPPSVRPAAPTVGQVPVGIVRPWAASDACTG